MRKFVTLAAAAAITLTPMAAQAAVPAGFTGTEPPVHQPVLSGRWIVVFDTDHLTAEQAQKVVDQKAAVAAAAGLEYVQQSGPYGDYTDAGIVVRGDYRTVLTTFRYDAALEYIEEDRILVIQ